ncbi:hypothetical protein ACF0H5_001531 [Mactra antiquata]
MRLTAFVILLSVLQGTDAFRVVCVYTNWAQYRPDGGKFLPEDVDPSLCTHLIYVYAKLKANKLAPVEWNDDGNKWSEGMYDRVNNLKQMNPDMKTLLGVGGWKMGSKDFSRMASGRIYRRMFAKSAVKFLRDRKFDGLTIDWQHPTKRGGHPRDRVNFSLLLQEIRRAFDEDSKKTGLPALLLTAGVSASQRTIEDAYEVDNITKYTDFINVFAYDFHGSWENYTGHPSQLYARSDEIGPSAEMNVDASMRYWMSHVADKSKLVLGVSTSGRTFTLADPTMNGVFELADGPGLEGDFTRQPGMLSYYERCFQYADATRVWDDVSKSAYWYSGDQWIAGEDEQSVKAKVLWSRRHNIGGVMLYSMAMDDFTDKCYNGQFPLLQTIHLAISDPLPELPPSSEIPTTLVITSPKTTFTTKTKTTTSLKPSQKAKNTVQVEKPVQNKSSTKPVGEPKPTDVNTTPSTTVQTMNQTPKEQLKETIKAVQENKPPNAKAPAGKRPGNKKGQPNRRKRPVRRRLTLEQRKRMIRQKMKNHKGKIPPKWKKLLNMNSGPKKNQNKNSAKPSPNKAKKENTGADTNAKPKTAADKPAETAKVKQPSTQNKNPGNSSEIKPNNSKPANTSKRMKFKGKSRKRPAGKGKKKRGRKIRRKGLGFNRKFKFQNGPNQKRPRERRLGNKKRINKTGN